MIITKENMNKKKKYICILGAGKMGLEYSNILRSKNYKIYAASSSSKRSKSWILFKKKNPNTIYLNNDEILRNSECNYIISCLPHLLQVDYFPKLLKSNKRILIEKPFSLNSNLYKKIIKKNSKNIKNGVIIIFFYLIEMNLEVLVDYFLIMKQKIGLKILSL